MHRAYYSESIETFLNRSTENVLGHLSEQSISAELTIQQINAWKGSINILQDQLKGLEGRVLFEYTIPRKGERVDAVVLYRNIVFLLEFKCGETSYTRSAKNQVCDYALDLRDFHQESHDKLLVPILAATSAAHSDPDIHIRDRILDPICCNAGNIKDALLYVADRFSTEPKFDYQNWEDSPYSPTPNIIEAAQALYNNHSVQEISRNDADAVNLTATTAKINEIIERSRRNGEKAICFVTGVPGAGKTLVGLNLAIKHINPDEGRAVFLSGNYPLVQVLQNALARDKVTQQKAECQKSNLKQALRETSSFIQIIHHYRDEHVGNENVPLERVAIFDEAQRAWTKEMIAQFMQKKKGIPDFDYSEPEFLIQTMDRHQGWAVIVCLVGGGQEINTGEAGLPEWFDSIRRSFPHWQVYLPAQLNEPEYLRGRTWKDLTDCLNVTESHELHLASSIRSYRAKEVASFVNRLISGNAEEAHSLFTQIREKYPIFLTRDLEHAKNWIRSQARGSARYGILASSGGLRLRRSGIWVKNKIDVTNWFLNPPEDVRSSYYLEDTATEFDVQGLELDYALVAWDADLRYTRGTWKYHSFKGTSWNNINKEENILYLKNAYRVLLTRARQGMVIFVPTGNADDETALPQYYDETFEYLVSAGMPVLETNTKGCCNILAE